MERSETARDCAVGCKSCPAWFWSWELAWPGLEVDEEHGIGSYS